MRLLMWRFRDSLNPEWGGRENAITTKDGGVNAELSAFFNDIFEPNEEDGAHELCVATG